MESCCDCKQLTSGHCWRHPYFQNNILPQLKWRWAVPADFNYEIGVGKYTTTTIIIELVNKIKVMDCTSGYYNF